MVVLLQAIHELNQAGMVGFVEPQRLFSLCKQADLLSHTWEGGGTDHTDVNVSPSLNRTSPAVYFSPPLPSGTAQGFALCGSRSWSSPTGEGLCGGVEEWSV